MVQERITEELQKQIDNCETYFDAKKLYECIAVKKKDGQPITWNGEDLLKTRNISSVTIYINNTYWNSATFINFYPSGRPCGCIWSYIKY